MNQSQRISFLIFLSFLDLGNCFQACMIDIRKTNKAAPDESYTISIAESKASTILYSPNSYLEDKNEIIFWNIEISCVYNKERYFDSFDCNKTAETLTYWTPSKGILGSFGTVITL